ncbi:flagellar motor switch protein FliG [Acidocella sp.]|uniref:flagellar motor switch protein FliG n=1 Tax=Acidocella sp. TaxID=50710 RepID=UPI0026039C3A|nr:flagellar motor switch protein FliG [Acidocella sp.]
MRMTDEQKAQSAEQLSGPTRAALVLRELGEDVASQILKEMDGAVVGKISQSFSSLRDIPVSTLNDVMISFAADLQGAGVGVDGIKFLTRVLTNALGDAQAKEILSKISKVKRRDVFQLPANTDPRALAVQISRERPQTIALLLAHVPHELAANILSNLPEELAAEALFRFTTLDVVSPIAVLELKEMLEKSVDLEVSGNRRVTNLGGPKQAADILNHFSSSLSDSILNTIKERDEVVSEKIKENLFTFIDLGNLPDRGMQILLREVNGDKLAAALRLVDDTLRNRFFQNMSSRQVEILKEELRSGPPIRRSDAIAAQAEVVEIALRLSSEGKITLGQTDEMI